MKKRVCAYCRVSTDKDDQVNSFNSQKQFFEEYIKKNEEWEFVEIYADEGTTGTSTEKRTEFLRMIEDVKYRKIDLILTKEISRFARNTLDSIYYTRKLKSMGVGVIFINDNINTLDEDAELRLTIMASLAQEESRRTSQRVKWGQKRQMEKGVVFGRELLGYDLKDGKLIINEQEAEIVRMIFHKFTNEGKGTYIIARELFEAGIKTKRGNLNWSNTMILKVLRNEKYVGDLCQKKTITPDFLTHKKKYNKGQEEMVYIKDHHEPVISRELWEATQKELKKRTTTKEQKSRHSNRYWCSGKIFCGLCGSRFIGRVKKIKSGDTYRAWRCQRAAEHGSQKTDKYGNIIGCNQGCINHVVLTEIIGYILKNIIVENKESIINDLKLLISDFEKPVKQNKCDALLKQIENINIKKQKLIDSMLEGIISKHDVSLMNDKYDKEIEVLRNKIKEIEEANIKNMKQADVLKSYIERIKQMANALEYQSADELYKKIVNKVVVHKNKILEVYLNCIVNPIKVRYNVKGRLDYEIKIEWLNNEYFLK
ncbi:MAG: recombinase family protein [Thermoplasmata archaeon]